MQTNSKKIWAGLITLYIVWGSTYLALRYIVDFVPPLIASGMRNVLAGSTLLLYAVLNSEFRKPTKTEFWQNIFIGFLMITVGNGLFTVVAHWVPSGYSSLFSSLSPVVIVLILWLLGEKPNIKLVAGCVLGFVGISILSGFKNRAIVGQEQNYGWSVLFLALALVAWNVGVVVTKRAKFNFSVAQLAGFQMFVGGTMSLIISFLLNEWDGFSISTVPASAYAALGYLFVFGSILGFTVFNWLSKQIHPTLLSTYNYVNPIVAIGLGALLMSEPIDAFMILAAVFIIGALVLITLAKR
jgi:drug/metabolite transporter (DMT)-like permease